MIFAPEMVRLITTSRKTQTRRPVRGDEPKSRYRPGRSYAVQPGRGKPASLRIVITDVRQEPLGDLTLADAHAEGFRTTDEFRLYWVALHDKAWIARQHKLLDAEHDFTDEDRAETIHIRALPRFNARHAHRHVWVITFELDRTEQPRYLAAGGSWNPAHAKRDQALREAGHTIPTTEEDSGYTHTAALSVQGEPEAVSDADQKLITAQAGRPEHWRALEEGHRERELRLLSLEDRIVRARRIARMRNVDIEREIWMVERLRQQGRTDEAVVHKLRGAERKIEQARSAA